MEEETLLVYHVLKDIFCWLKAVPRPIEHLLADDFLFFVMEAVEIRMRKTLLHSVPLIRIESQHLRKEISCGWLDIGEKFFPGLSRPLRQRFYVLNRILIP